MTMSLQNDHGPGMRRFYQLLTRRSDLAEWSIRGVTALLPGIFLAVIALQPWAEAKWMFLDPLTAAELSTDCCRTYYGFASTVGVMLWVATAAICLFSAVLIAMWKLDKNLLKFAATAGVLTGWLALDDAFLVHELVLPSLGVPQNLVLAIYVVLALAYAGASWRIIIANDFWLLLIGGGAFAVSLGVDTVFQSLDPALVLIEDSAKFFGIFCWASFHITALARNLASAPPGAGEPGR